MGDSIRDELNEDAIRGFADAYIAGDDVPALSVVAESGMLRVAAGFARSSYRAAEATHINSGS